MVAWSVIKTWYAKRLQPNKKPALIHFLVLLIVQLLGQTVAFPHYTNSFISCGAPVLKPQTPENYFMPQITQQRQRGVLIGGGDRDAWMAEAYDVKEPLITLPFRFLSYTPQANAWPKILLLVSLPLQRLLLHVDGGHGCQVSEGDHSPRSCREVPPTRSIWSQSAPSSECTAKELAVSKELLLWTGCTPPCWLPSVVLCTSTELGPIGAPKLCSRGASSPLKVHQSLSSAAQQRKAEHFHPTKASLTPHRWTSWDLLPKRPSYICTEAHRFSTGIVYRRWRTWGSLSMWITCILFDYTLKTYPHWNLAFFNFKHMLYLI